MLASLTTKVYSELAYGVGFEKGGVDGPGGGFPFMDVGRGRLSVHGP